MSQTKDGEESTSVHPRAIKNKKALNCSCNGLLWLSRGQLVLHLTEDPV